MAKKFAKRVIAIIAVTAMLCAFSMSAFAATYTSTTTYYNSVDKIQVTTNVSGLAGGDEVTYLAYKGDGAFNPKTSEIVYVNQYTTLDTETTAKTFSYVTDSTYVGSSIMMAKADSTFANGEAIGVGTNETGKIDAATVTFNVSVNGGAAVPTAVECAAGEQTVSIPVNLTAKDVTAVVISDSAKSYAATNVIAAEDKIQLDWNITETSYDVAITTKDADVAVAAPTFVAGAKYDSYTAEVYDGTELKEITGVAYAVIADATYTPVEGYKVGVAFASEAFTVGGTAPTDAVYYESLGNARDSENRYAIVIIDDSNPAPTGKVYYATYMKDAEGNYTYGSTGSIDLTAPQA